MLVYDKPEIETLRGRPYEKVSPKRTHSLVQRELLLILERCGARDYGEFGAEWRYRVGRADATSDSLLPDVAFTSYERLASLSDRDIEEPPFSPDLVIEVRSPSQGNAFVLNKVSRYLETGAQLVLIVDPKARTVYAAGSDDTLHLYSENERFAHAAFPWLQFAVAEIFLPLKRR